tara:strand:+ start:282 stop:512 length:231 start_codon:yes stop_codon:yes gene_type:complete
MSFLHKNNKVITSFLKEEFVSETSMDHAANNITSGYDKHIDQSVPERDITLMEYNPSSDSLYKLDYLSILAEHSGE